jgi:hypothetical protein
MMATIIDPKASEPRWYRNIRHTEVFSGHPGGFSLWRYHNAVLDATVNSSMARSNWVPQKTACTKNQKIGSERTVR